MKDFSPANRTVYGHMPRSEGIVALLYHIICIIAIAILQKIEKNKKIRPNFRKGLYKRNFCVIIERKDIGINHSLRRVRPALSVDVAPQKRVESGADLTNSAQSSNKLQNRLPFRRFYCIIHTEGDAEIPPSPETLSSKSQGNF